ncbi:MAG: ABC-2 family transporter protein [Xanthomonadaceae bacterium]|nr:ABC-2 family transporter protein [Xanthomonadaceae bacterium]
MEFKQYFNIFMVQVKNNWVREAVYRTNFITSFIVDLIWIVIEASLFSVIYAHTDNLGGWTIHQVYFFLGIFFASDALFSIFFMRNFWMFSDLINKGELDIMLTKPVGALFLALTRWMSLTNVLNLAMGIGVCIHYADAAGFKGGWHWVELTAWLGVGLLTQSLVRFAFVIWTFWTERGWALSRLYYQFFSIATKPDVIYPAIVRYTLMTFLPFAFVASVPARALILGLEMKEYAGIATVLLGFLLFNRWAWKSGLKRYQSASS